MIHPFLAPHNNMETPRTGTSFKPEEAYAAAAERFFELMKTFGMAGGTSTDWQALAAPLERDKAALLDLLRKYGLTVAILKTEGPFELSQTSGCLTKVNVTMPATVLCSARRG